MWILGRELLSAVFPSSHIEGFEGVWILGQELLLAVLPSLHISNSRRWLLRASLGSLSITHRGIRRCVDSWAKSFSWPSFHHCTSAIRRLGRELLSRQSILHCTSAILKEAHRKEQRLIKPHCSNLSKAFHTSRITFEQDRHQADCDILLALGWCYLAHCKHQRNKAFLHLSHHIGAREALYHFFVIYYRPWAGVSS